MLLLAECDLQREVDGIEGTAASEGALMRLIPRSNSPRLGEKHIFPMSSAPVTGGQLARVVGWSEARGDSLESRGR